MAKRSSDIRSCVILGLIILVAHSVIPIFNIPSGSMKPTLQVGDSVLIERVSPLFGREIQRGDIVVFYPPPIEIGRSGGQELSHDPLTLLGRLLVIPPLVGQTPFIKRVVGLAGDNIRIEAGKGVFVNGKLLSEPYVAAKPDYNLKVLSDIGGTSTAGSRIRPFGSDTHPIVVPPGQLFMMGDNRNDSADSHFWGFLDEGRVIGRLIAIF
jgi:signal peptidase I